MNQFDINFLQLGFFPFFENKIFTLKENILKKRFREINLVFDFTSFFLALNFIKNSGYHVVYFRIMLY